MGGGSRGNRVSYAPKGHSNKTLPEYTSQSDAGVKRAFISFHVADEAQVNFLRAQAKSEDNDLEFIDYSVKEPFDEKWKTQCMERLKQSSVVLVMIGQDTHTREAVLWEIQKAYELGKPVIGIKIYRDENHTIPKLLLDNKAEIINWKLSSIQGAIENAKKTEIK